MKKLITKIKDRILRYSIFVRKREMFFISDNKIIEPRDCHKNMTHREWFENINIDLGNTLRGYYNNGLIMLYTGLDHDIKVFPSVLELLSVYEYFIKKKKYRVNKIGLGSFHSRWRTFIGKDWKPRYILNMDDVKRTEIEDNYQNKILIFNKDTKMLDIVSSYDS